MLEIKNLTKSYRINNEKIDVLKSLNFNLDDGKVLCILGPSGSGKSTLLNIIGGIDRGDEGSVNVLGNELSNMKRKELEMYRRKHLGFVFQFYNLISDLNVRENIEVGAYLSENPIEIESLISNLSLENQAHNYPNEISGGQAQRTSIARAIIKKPKLLICDEPTGALDYESAKEVLNLIENLNKTYNATIIIATHNTQIAKMCDMILTLHDGTIRSMEENREKISARSVNW